MIGQSSKLRLMLQIGFQFSKKSSSQNTPRLFKNPKLTPRGLITKKPKSYNYDLPEDLPNRHLYWNRKQMNKVYRQKYKTQRLRKLKINPIFNADKQRTFQRQLPELIAEMTSVRLIKASMNRTMQNLYEAVTRFSQQFVGHMEGNKIVRGNSFDILCYTLKEVHDRHMPTMEFYNFSTYCQLRFISRMRPTPQLLCHFFKHLEGMKEQKNERQISMERLSQLSNYIFSTKFPEQYQEILYKKQVEFELFKDVEPDNKSFEHIIPQFYGQDQLKNQVQTIKKFDQKQRQVIFKSIEKLPGGKKLIERANAYL